MTCQSNDADKHPKHTYVHLSLVAWLRQSGLGGLAQASSCSYLNCSLLKSLPGVIGSRRPDHSLPSMDPKGVSFQPSVPETPSTSGVKKRRGTPSSGSKFVQELLTPPGKHSKRKTDYEQLLSQFNRIPSQESLALVAALGAIVLVASFAVPYWRCVLFPLFATHSSHRADIPMQLHQLQRDCASIEARLSFLQPHRYAIPSPSAPEVMSSLPLRSRRFCAGIGPGSCAHVPVRAALVATAPTCWSGTLDSNAACHAWLASRPHFPSCCFGQAQRGGRCTQGFRPEASSERAAQATQHTYHTRWHFWWSCEAFL